MIMERDNGQNLTRYFSVDSDKEVAAFLPMDYAMLKGADKKDAFKTARRLG